MIKRQVRQPRRTRVRTGCAGYICERNQRFTRYRFPFSPAMVVTASTSVSSSESLV